MQKSYILPFPITYAMAATILDGKALAREIRDNLRKQVKSLTEKPGLAVITVGNDPASQLYVGGKEKAGIGAGYHFVWKKYKEDTDEITLLSEIDKLNQDKKIHGMIVQSPLPKHLSPFLIIDAIRQEKDADGFHPLNLANLFLGRDAILPATPKGIMRILEHYNIPLAGKHAVVIGRSKIVGKPIAFLLLQKDATVTMCHSMTADLAALTRQADIIVAAVGKAWLVKKDMVKQGAVVIDVGMNKKGDKIIGDVAYDEVKEVASAITPVPGGVGPMTIAMLLENTLKCMEVQ